MTVKILTFTWNEGGAPGGFLAKEGQCAGQLGNSETQAWRLTAMKEEHGSWGQ